MKEKTYTVTVTGHKRGEYRITAKYAYKAESMARMQFESEHGEYFDYIEARAVADWVKKEE